MNLKKCLSMFMVAGVLLSSNIACKSKISDADLKAKVEAAVKTNPAVTVDVKEGVVTLNGTASSEEEKAKLEEAAKAAEAKGIKSVVNNIVVTVPVTETPIVVNTVDSDLTAKVNTFIKDFPSIKAAVKDGVISITGELEKARVQALKMGLDALNPKKVDLSALTVK